MFRRLFLAALAAVVAVPVWAETDLAPATADDFDIFGVTPTQVRFLGPSGSGKTTTVTVLPGWVAVNGGRDGAIYGDLAGEEIWFADDKNRRLVQLSAAMAVRTAMGGGNAEANAALDEAFAGLEAIIEERLKDVPEDQRPLVEEAMRDAVGLPPVIETVGGEISGYNIYEDPAFRDDIGRETYRAEALGAAGPVRSLDLVALGEIPEAQNIVKAIALLVAMHRQMTGDDLPGESLFLDLLAVGTKYFIVAVTDHRTGERWKLEGIKPYAPGLASVSADALHVAMAADD
ncbi:ABC transporter ATP-binding protein [Maritimibacter sp. UBA3975]|uniref:ATP-binding cassette domain-containing protein n=1 Tax=Maritimibacter sp. UBA3975 TaxID=1946833 RepID=UPI000C0AC8CE|nr:ABC transporter ATP-binding protein [Maritimibacter sp. UBA3975]MAM61811.1 hypothetical protein [Maritimibacter sp.]|tara:strand:- start:2983 stop:3849 length:867 start_codon:yes stop_codon:yes gene_type:complete